MMDEARRDAMRDRWKDRGAQTIEPRRQNDAARKDALVSLTVPKIKCHALYRTIASCDTLTTFPFSRR